MADVTAPDDRQRPPRRASAVLYALDVARATRFYTAVVGMECVGDEETFAVLVSDVLELAVVRIPDEIAATIAIADPPVRREETPIKLVLEVTSIAAARAVAAAHGGSVDPATEEWQWGDDVVCDAVDPEGNVVQLREPGRVLAG